jgi:plasmid segregation protein ParM
LYQILRNAQPEPAMSATTKPVFCMRSIGGEQMNIGMDVGYSATKAVSDKRRVNFPSVVGTPDKARFSLNGSNAIILTQPAHVQVGEGAIVQSRFVSRREDRHWVESDEWYTLALASLTELTSATRADLRIVTGLPVSFYSDKAQVRDRLLGEHKVQREGRRAQVLRVTDCRVIPQPFGALLAATLDNRGRIVDNGLASGAVGVIDCGGKTTNLLSVNRLAEIGRETASVNVGAWDAVRAVRGWLADNCPNLELRDHQVSDAIIERQVRYYGEPVDLTEAVEVALEPLADQVLAEATQLWNGGAALDAILVSGGGALLLGPYVKAHFRHARVVSEPVFANALGFWRFAQRVASGIN